MAKEKVISIILLMGMFVSVCVIGWYGIDTDVREEYVKTHGEVMEQSANPAARAIADGQMSALELTSMVDDSFDTYSNFTQMSQRRQEIINAEYKKHYGITYPTFFGFYLVSLFSVAILLLMLIVRLVGHCRGHRGAGWELVVLSALSMSYFIVCARAQTDLLEFDYGGFITVALALASAIFWKISKNKK